MLNNNNIDRSKSCASSHHHSEGYNFKIAPENRKAAATGILSFISKEHQNLLKESNLTALMETLLSKFDEEKVLADKRPETQTAFNTHVSLEL